MSATTAARRAPVLAVAALAVAAVPLWAEQKKPATVTPAERLAQPFWKARHEAFLARTRQIDPDVIFLGDSITQGWEGNGKAAWQKHFEPLKAANLGISGDRTEHVLWRITTGKELEGISPKVAVVMIGTNNAGSNSAAEIAEGIAAIVRELRRQKPSIHVLLLGVFPRSAKPTDKVRDKLKEVNERIAKLDDGKHVHYLDIGPKFLEPDGSLSKEIMPDYLHLSPKGYAIWAEAVAPEVQKLLRK
jgi:beta-glucosidase